MGLRQISFVEEVSAPLSLAEATAPQVSSVHILVLEASCPPASVVLPSPHRFPAALNCFSYPKISISLPGLVTLGLSPICPTSLLPAEPADGDDSLRRKPDAVLRALNAEVAAFLPRQQCRLSEPVWSSALLEPSAISCSTDQAALIFILFFLPLMHGCWWLLFLLVSLLVKDNSLLESTIIQLANRLFHKSCGLQGVPSLPIKDTCTWPFLEAGVSKPVSRTGT